MRGGNTEDERVAPRAGNRAKIATNAGAARLIQLPELAASVAARVSYWAWNYSVERLIAALREQLRPRP